MQIKGVLVVALLAVAGARAADPPAGCLGCVLAWTGLSMPQTCDTWPNYVQSVGNVVTCLVSNACGSEFAELLSQVQVLAGQPCPYPGGTPSTPRIPDDSATTDVPVTSCSSSANCIAGAEFCGLGAVCYQCDGCVSDTLVVGGGTCSQLCPTTGLSTVDPAASCHSHAQCAHVPGGYCSSLNVCLACSICVDVIFPPITGSCATVCPATTGSTGSPASTAASPSTPSVAPSTPSTGSASTVSTGSAASTSSASVSTGSAASTPSVSTGSAASTPAVSTGSAASTPAVSTGSAASTASTASTAALTPSTGSSASTASSSSSSSSSTAPSTTTTTTTTTTSICSTVARHSCQACVALGCYHQARGNGRGCSPVPTGLADPEVTCTNSTCCETSTPTLPAVGRRFLRFRLRLAGSASLGYQVFREAVRLAFNLTQDTRIIIELLDDGVALRRADGTTAQITIEVDNSQADAVQQKINEELQNGAPTILANAKSQNGAVTDASSSASVSTVDASSGDDDDGLSGGATAGIVIAVLVALAALVAVAMYRQRHHSSGSSRGQVPTNPSQKPLMNPVYASASEV